MVITQDGLRLRTINIFLQFIINLPLDDGIVLDKLHRYNAYINSSYKIGDMSCMKINTK